MFVGIAMYTEKTSFGHCLTGLHAPYRQAPSSCDRHAEDSRTNVFFILEGLSLCLLLWLSVCG